MKNNLTEEQYKWYREGVKYVYNEIMNEPGYVSDDTYLTMLVIEKEFNLDKDE